MTNETYVPIINATYLNANGLLISNNATTPNTKLDITAGLARDQTNTYDINLGNFLGANPGLPADVTTTVNAAVVGAGGIDVGTLGNNKVYYVYILLAADYTTSAMISLAAPSAGPVMPYNYLAYRHIGFIVTNSSAQFLPAYWSGNRNSRNMSFDAPQATAVSAGNATSYTNVNLTNWVPLINNTPVSIYSAFTPGAASRTLNLSPAGATGNAIQITGQVTSVVVTSVDTVLARNATISSVLSPAIEYKVANSGDAVALYVGGFQYDI
jgi:hypothetical protein